MIWVYVALLFISIIIVVIAAQRGDDETVIGALSAALEGILDVIANIEWSDD